MLPCVNYAELYKDEMFGFSLVDLEYETLENLRKFVEGLKEILLREQLVQLPEIMTAYLCAYLGFFTVKVLGKEQAKTLIPEIPAVMEARPPKSTTHFAITI